MIEYIKEFRDNGDGTFRIVLRSNSYGHNMEFFQTMFKVAESIFANLTPYQADVVHYAGRSYSGTYGIEFLIHDADKMNNQEVSKELLVSSGFREIAQTEMCR